MKKNFLMYSLLALGLVLGTSAAANAMVVSAAPEVDPSSAIGALTLLAGSLAVLRARLKK